MVFTDLPDEIMHVIKNIYLNEEHMRDNASGEFEKDATGPTAANLTGLVKNNQHDPKATQGLPIVWKRVCKTWLGFLRCNVESSLLFEEGSVKKKLFEWIREDWNPVHDPVKDVKLFGMIIDRGEIIQKNVKVNEGLVDEKLVDLNCKGNEVTEEMKHLLKLIANETPQWHDPKLFSEHATKEGLINVLEWLCKHPRFEVQLDHLARVAIREGNCLPALNWILAEGKGYHTWNAGQLREIFHCAIKHGDNPDVVAIVHEAKGKLMMIEPNFSVNSHRKPSTYQSIRSIRDDSDNTEDENERLFELGEDGPDKLLAPGAKRAKKRKQSAAWAQKLVNAGPLAWSSSNYGNERTEISCDISYREACPWAAKYGRLATLELLQRLGYELNKQIMMMAMVAVNYQHVGVAAWAEEHGAICTVRDMINAGHWSIKREREWDCDIDNKMCMSAYEYRVEVEANRQAKADRLANAMQEALKVVAYNPICDRCSQTLNGDACCRHPLLSRQGR